jgi:hypothetical protein
MVRLFSRTFRSLLLIALVGSSTVVFAQKVKERNKKKPDWVDEPQPNTLVSCAVANDLESAKKAAINNIREQIASSISSKVQSTFTQNTREEVSGSSRVWNEETESKTLIETQLAGALSGVSDAFASDLYWEKIATGKSISYNCCIQYPFSKKELDDFIAQFEINRLKIKHKRETLLQTYNACKTLTDITTLSAGVKQELAAADPLFKDVLKAFSEFLRKETDKLTPRIEKENTSSLLVSFLTASGKRVSVNPVYTVDSNVLRYEQTNDNCDSVIFQPNTFSGRRNIALTAEYQFKNKPLTETLYWTPAAAARLDLKEVSMATFKAEGTIVMQFEISGDAVSELVSVSITDSKGPRKLIPAAGNAACRNGVNTIRLAPVDSTLLGTDIFVMGRMYDVQVLFKNSDGTSKEKTYYNVVMN